MVLTQKEAEYLYKHPIYAYFHVSLGIWEAIRDNAGDMWRNTGNPAADTLHQAVCLLVALKHIAIVLFYPAAKLVYIVLLRRKLRSLLET